jgi:selenocysteine lyase/cysteine desulfurase
VNAPLETITFVQNATTGINVVLRNLEYESGDVILSCENIYGACNKTIEYVCQTTSAESEHYVPTFPMTEDDLVAGFEATIRRVTEESNGKRRVKVALFDTISSIPAARWPFERLVKVCREYGVLSCMDAAHGIGAIDLDLTAVDPDFFVTNCHK